MYPWTGTYTRGPVYPEIVPQKVEPLEGDLYIQEPDINYGEGEGYKMGKSRIKNVLCPTPLETG